MSDTHFHILEYVEIQHASIDCMVDVEEFSIPKISRNSQLWQHCEVKHGAKEELLWCTPGLFCQTASLSLFRVS